MVKSGLGSQSLLITSNRTKAFENDIITGGFLLDLA
jgi:hypothetical protein